MIPNPKTLTPTRSVEVYLREMRSDSGRYDLSFLTDLIGEDTDKRLVEAAKIRLVELKWWAENFYWES